MRRLLVMRHAKSDWEVGADDHRRPLNTRGTRAAAVMGRLLAQIGEVPDVAMTSTATRARTTLALACEAGKWTTEVLERDDLYNTSVDGALAAASQAPDEAETLMLVGHQPTWSALVERLTGGNVLVRTATVVGIDLPIRSWSPLPSGAMGDLAFVLQARHFDTGDHA